MLHKPITNRAVILWSFMAGIEGFLAAYFLAKEPSESESIFAFGLSLQLLFIVIIVLLSALLFLGVSVAHFYRLLSWKEFLNSKPRLFRFVLSGTFILGITLLQVWLLLPEYHFPTISGYLDRLQSVLIWLVLFFLQTFIFLVYLRNWSLKNLMNWRENAPVIISLVVAIIVWGVIAATKIGISPDEFYWNMAGVPLLVCQIGAAIGVTLLGAFIYNQIVPKKRIARLSHPTIFVGIWIVAATVWIRTPLVPTFNAPGPYFPSKEFYPFVDAALFDLGAQSAIYGRGFFFGTFFDRGLLMGFLTLIHMIFGQSYLVTVNVQTAVYAVFPALLYLLGQKLHSKSVGILAAALSVFKVSNAISGGKWLSTSHPKLLLTEVPTGIVLVVFSLLLVTWLKRNNSKSYYLVGIGATIGLGILLRTHAFFLFPVVFIIGLFGVWRQQWKRMTRDVLLVIAAFFITISPWMWRNYQVAGEPLFFLQRFDRVIEERYQPQGQLEQNELASIREARALKNNTTTTRIEKYDVFEQYQFVPNHFVHNIITSVLILPPSPVWDDLRHVVDKYPYWGRIPDMQPGEISGSMGIFLAVNLIILSIGLGTAWKRVRYIAFVPLAVFLFYNLANAFARTSGGRYIVPVDWVIYFYYAIGLVEIIRFCISMLGFQTGDFFDRVRHQHRKAVSRKFNWGGAGLMILPFFLTVAALPIIEFASQEDKPPETTEALIEQLDEISFFDVSGLSQPEMEEFFNDPNATLISGRGFYPRYYPHGQGEPILPGQMTVYTARDYPRLVFTLLLPNTDKPVLLPIDEPRLYFPDATEVIVGGCQVGQSTALKSYFNYIDAAFIVILDDTDVIYVRVPEAPLSCPLREPVCDNNRNCN